MKTQLVEAELRGLGKGTPHASPSSQRIPVLHLMNNVCDCSITSIVLDQLQHFGDQEFEWHIGGLDGVDPDEPFSALNAKVIDFARVAKGRSSLLATIRNYIRDHQIDLVHTHTPRTTLVAKLAMGRTGRRTKMLTTKHLHALSQERPAWGRLFACVDRLSDYLPDHLVAVSQDVGDKIRAMPGIRRSRVTVIRNAVDIDAYYDPATRDATRAEFGIGNEAAVLGFAGRLARQKRLDLLLDAFREVLQRYPSAKLLIAGVGKEGDQLATHAEQLGVSGQVIWAGHRRDMPQVFSAIDMYVQPSINEGLSLSLLQAMAAHKPVVATDVGGTREVVNELTGMLIPPGSSSSIAKSVLHLLDYPQEAVKLSENARRLVEDRFSVGTQMESYRDVYSGLISRPSLK